jgi:hypothetical protein
MNFADVSLQAALQDWAAHAEVSERACAHNLLFEEHVGAPRRAAFEAHATPLPSPAGSLSRAAQRYYETRVRVNRGVPDTFSALNVDAAYRQLSGDMALVRLEDLRYPLGQLGLDTAALERAHGRRDRSSQILVANFLRDWSVRGDVLKNPVSFAAVEEHLVPELGAEDWPEQLRNRLGLSHLDPREGPIPVALMKYTVQDILDAAAAPGMVGRFYVPTSLDQGPNRQFFPTPHDLKYGCPMALEIVLSEEDLIAEVLHPRLAYSPRNFIRFGYVALPPPSIDFASLRNAHLEALQLLSLRDDFGAPL